MATSCRAASMKPISHIPRRLVRAASAPSRRARVRLYAQEDSAKAAQAEKPEAVEASEEEAEVEDAASASEEQLSTVERLVTEIQAGDLEAAGTLAQDVQTEMETLATIVETAQAEARATQATLETLKDQYRRLQADFDNFRSRSDKEKQEAGQKAKMNIVQDLLPLVDNFELAASQVKTSTEGEEKINNSYQGLYKQMVDIFRGMGLEAVPTEGSPFDPEIHDAIMREETTEVEDGLVMQEFRKGFRLGDKLLRPAMVKVAYNESSTSGTSASETASDSDAKDN